MTHTCGSFGSAVNLVGVERCSAVSGAAGVLPETGGHAGRSRRSYARRAGLPDDVVAKTDADRTAKRAPTVRTWKCTFGCFPSGGQGMPDDTGVLPCPCSEPFVRGAALKFGVVSTSALEPSLPSSYRRQHRVRARSMQPCSVQIAHCEQRTRIESAGDTLADRGVVSVAITASVRPHRN